MRSDRFKSNADCIGEGVWKRSEMSPGLPVSANFEESRAEPQKHPWELAMTTSVDCG